MIKRVLKIALLIGVVVMMLLQLVPVNYTLPVAERSHDFLIQEQPDSHIAQLIKVSCYDCHSHHTEYPWYSYVAPISFYIENHVEEGREELNFSEWATYSKGRADHKLEECIELLEEGEMPLNSYTWLHSKADLSKEERAVLSSYFQDIKQ